MIQENPRSGAADQSNKSDGDSLAYGPMIWAMAAAFGTYFCMYAFRKPFAVAEFDAVDAWGWQYKTVAVASQVLGYALAKFIGIGVLSGLASHKRAASIVALIALAEIALIFFGLIPAPLNLVCLFVNGLALGMVFGLVVGFLEGRRQTEAMAAVLCTSFILADGVTKSVGKALLVSGVGQFWMPAAVGLLFFPPLILFVWMLRQVPGPSAADIAARSERPPINSADRHAFFRKYAWGLIPLLIMFLLVTIVRSIRSDFQPEIWQSLGVSATPELFSYSELWVGLGVTLANGIAVFVSDNFRAFRLAIATCVVGFLLILASTFGQQAGWVAPFPFMVLIGLGLYLPYVATHTTLFERLIAMTRDRGNLVFLMCLADSIGYLGYVLVMLVRNVFDPDINFMLLFRPVCYVVAIVSLACMVGCQYYFSRYASSGFSPANNPALQTPSQTIVFGESK